MTVPASDIERALTKAHFYLAAGAGIVGGQIATRKLSLANLGVAVDYAKKAGEVMMKIGGVVHTPAPDQGATPEPAEFHEQTTRQEKDHDGAA